MTRALLLTLPLLALACAAPVAPKAPENSHTEGPGPATEAIPEAWKNKCDASKGQLRPLVVEWSAPERAALEAQARQGQIVVHYEGCDLKVLRQCKAPAKFDYRYTAITPKEEVVTMTNAEQLYASIPVYAAKFEGKLAQSGQLTAAMTIVGEYGVAGEPPAIDQLQGECQGATHVVTALTTGAFSFFAGSSKEASASVQVMGVGVGGEVSRKSENLSRDGDIKSCGASRRGDGIPPEGCGATLRLELSPLLAAGEGVPLECKPGTRLVGKACKPVDKPSELAPEDRSFVDEKHGFNWGTRCYHHYRAGSLHYARAACKKGLEAGPDEDTRGAILFNYALVEEASGDPISACEMLSQSLAVRESKSDPKAVAGVRKQIEKFKCAEVVKKK